VAQFGGLLALPVDDRGHAIPGIESEAQLLRHPQGPDIVEAANQHNRPFAKQREAGLGSGQDTEALVPGFESRGGPGQRNHVSQRQVAGEMQTEVKRLLLRSAHRGVEGIDRFYFDGFAGSPRQYVAVLVPSVISAQKRSTEVGGR